MADTLNSFPLILSIQEDGSLKTTVNGIEQYITTSAGRATQAFGNLARQISDLTNRKISASADPFGWKAMVDGLSAAPLQKAIASISAAENALDRQRERARAENIAGIQREFDAAMSAIRAKQAAQTEAFRQAEAEGNALIALDRQRIAESAAQVAAPTQQPATIYYDPKGSQAAAAAARAHAAALEQVAGAAQLALTSTTQATAADRAFALTAREAANAAGVEADRLEQLAATQGRVAAAAVAAGVKMDAAGELIANSVRGQRFATIQASQQFQDFFIQVQGGQNVLVAFSQQASQLAFVLSAAGGTTGKFAAFMGGPWGTAIFAGLSVLTLLTSGLFDNKKAHEEAAKAAKEFGDRQANIKNFIDAVTGALVEQNKTLVTNAILTRQAAIAANKKEVDDSRRKAFDAANSAALRATQAAPGTTTSGISFGDNTKVQQVIRDAGGNVEKLVTGLAALAQSDKTLAKVALEVSNIGGQAVLAERRNKELNDELRALNGDTGAIRRNAAQLSGLVAIAAATDKYTKAIATLTEKKRALDASYDNKSFKGTQADYVAQAAALEKQIKLTEKAKSDAQKAANSGKADANRQANERRQELFADAAAIGDGTDAIKAANSTYAAEILRLKNQLREGLISPEAAKQAAITARQVRNASLDLVEGAKKLDEELQRASQQFDGEASFVDRIQKASAAVAKARSELGALGTAKIGENIYDAAGLDKLQAGIDAAYVKPITDATRALDEQRQIDEALLANRGVEAEFLRRKFSILQAYGTLTDQERANLEAQIAPLREALDLEHQRGLALDALNAKRQVELDYVRDTGSALRDATRALARGDIAGLLKSPGKLLEGLQNYQGDKLFEKLFGQTFRDLEDQINGGTGLRAANARMAASADTVATASDGAATSLDTLTEAVNAAAQALSTRGAFTPGSGPATVDPATGDIVVTAGRAASNLVGDAPIPPEMRQWLSRLPALTRTTTSTDPISAAIGKLSTSIVGLFTDPDNAKAIGSSIGKFSGAAFEGAATGSLVAGVGNALGLGLSKQGAQIGGAIGGLANSVFGKALGAFGPVAGLVGGVLGGIFGGLFRKVKFGTAAVSSVNGSAVTGGNDATATSNAGSLAGSVQSGLAKIADTLNAQLGAFNVSIGTFDGKYRVSTTGFTGSLDSKNARGQGLVDFGPDGAEAAVRFAILDAIRDGAIKGIRQGAINLLKNGKDLDTALQKALSFQQVFKDLKARTDPMGAALDEVNEKFDKLRATFAEAGATAEELADLEKLYGFERADAVKQAQQQISGALQDFLDGLRFKDDNGLSLRTREAAAKAAFDPLAATIRSGGKVDQDAFTSAAQTYLDIYRQLYGSTQTYFDKLADITGLTEKAIVNAGGTVTNTAQQVAQAAQSVAPTGSNGGSVVATTAGGAAALGLAANDNAAVAASIVQALAAQTEALKIPADRVAQMTAVQFSEAMRAALITSPPAAQNVVPIRTDPALVTAMQLQIRTLEQQTALLNAQVSQLSAVNKNLGKVIEQNAALENDKGYAPIRGNF